jgi:very-short-patch-repair endonuclease
MNKLTLNARNLRKNMTTQERKLWNIIKNKQFYNYKFLRQYVIGGYIVDFICREEKIIVEIDGGQHNQNENIKYDKNRNKYLENLGYKVVRFWNNEIDDNIEGVYRKLQEIFMIKTATTLTLPRKGRYEKTSIKK